MEQKPSEASPRSRGTCSAVPAVRRGGMAGDGGLADGQLLAVIGDEVRRRRPPARVPRAPPAGGCARCLRPPLPRTPAAGGPDGGVDGGGLGGGVLVEEDHHRRPGRHLPHARREALAQCLRPPLPRTPLPKGPGACWLQPDLRGWRSPRAPPRPPPLAGLCARRPASPRKVAGRPLPGSEVDSSAPPRTPPGGPGGRARPRPRPRGLAAATSPQRQEQPRPFRALSVQCQAPFVPHPGPPPPVAEGGPRPGPRGAAAAASPQRQQPRPAWAPPRELTRAAALLPRRTR